jgi:bifunctional DNA-binding transcriptional regulator/antitoxin component of YhaV-PrlF toxin-antitoxin module
MTSTTFDAVILGMGNNTGIEIPPAHLEALGGGKRPPVVVAIGDYSYRSTPGVMGGRSLIPLPKAHREASGLKAGDAVTVTLTLEEGTREVSVPAPLAAALDSAGLTEAFEALAYSRRKEFARQVAEAKTEQTRDRRITKVVDALRSS